MARLYNEEILKKRRFICHISWSDWYKCLFGDYQKLDFKQLVIPKDGAPYEIYRFKEDFSKNKKVEVRVILDESSKLAGFWVTHWKDSL